MSVDLSDVLRLFCFLHSIPNVTIPHRLSVQYLSVFIQEDTEAVVTVTLGIQGSITGLVAALCRDTESV